MISPQGTSIGSEKCQLHFQHLAPGGTVEHCSQIHKTDFDIIIDYFSTLGSSDISSFLYMLTKT